MMSDRGYTPVDDAAANPCRYKSGNVIACTWHTSSLSYKKHVDEVWSVYKKCRGDHKVIIMVLDDNIGAAVKKAVAEFESNKTDLTIQLFHISELAYNPTHNETVPKHKLVTSEEKERLVKYYGLNPDTCEELLRIPETDVICRYYGYTKGQVLCIHEKSVTRPGKTELTYALVC